MPKRVLCHTGFNAGQKYCRRLQEDHSAILSTFIKVPFVINVLVLSIFERPLKTGFTVYVNQTCVIPLVSHSQRKIKSLPLLPTFSAFNCSLKSDCLLGLLLNYPVNDKSVMLGQKLNNISSLLLKYMTVLFFCMMTMGIK